MSITSDSPWKPCGVSSQQCARHRRSKPKIACWARKVRVGAGFNKQTTRKDFSISQGERDSLHGTMQSHQIARGCTRLLSNFHMGTGPQDTKEPRQNVTVGHMRIRTITAHASSRVVAATFTVTRRSGICLSDLGVAACGPTFQAVQHHRGSTRAISAKEYGAGTLRR